MKPDSTPHSNPLSDEIFETMLTRTTSGLFDGAASQAAFRKRMLVVRRFASAIPSDASGVFLVVVPRSESEAPAMKTITAELTVGRGEKAQWQIPDDQMKLSSLHFSINRRDGECILTDSDSRNGTRLNEDPRPVRTCHLKHGDFIHAGGFTFMVAIIPQN